MLIDAKSLVACRDDSSLFSPVSFTVEKGGLLVFVGPNGIGKSTLLKMLCGLHPIGAGQCEKDDNLTFMYSGHAHGFNRYLTSEENLAFAAALLNGKASTDTILGEVGLAHEAGTAYAELSQGQRQRLSLARCLLSSATLWVLDEPFAGLDREGIVWMQTKMLNHVTSGGAIIFTSHQPTTFDYPHYVQVTLCHEVICDV